MARHAIFSPSSASRWLRCTAAFGLALHLPDPPESDYAADGTQKHDLAAEILLCQSGGATASELAFLAPYLDHCTALMNATDCQWHEVEVTIEHSPLLFGTPDFAAHVGDTLHVVDLKTGAGVMVDPEENDQALAYAYMTLARYKAADLQMPDKVVLTIVQPTDEDKPVKSWETTPEHVMAWGERAEAVMEDTVTGKAHDYVPGEHCRWCKAKPVCPKLRGALVDLPVGMGAAELGALATAEVLDRADLVLQFIDAVRAHGHDLASRGIDVPGWTLKPKRAMRVWVDTDKVWDWARRQRVVNLMTDQKLLSPAQVEKTNKLLYARVADMVTSVSSGTNLVRGNPPVHVAPPEGASKMARLLGNIETLKYRK